MEKVQEKNLFLYPPPDTTESLEDNIPSEPSEEDTTVTKVPISDPLCFAKPTMEALEKMPEHTLPEKTPSPTPTEEPKPTATPTVAPPTSTPVPPTTQAALPQGEYPAATYVWNTLREAGYSEVVTAGIIGNMMIECGGYTMNLHTTIYNPTGLYYGICQWNVNYYPSVVGSNLETQVNFLMQTMEYELNTFGPKTCGYNYASFLNIADPETAALAFAKAYERCGSGSYTKRQTCARTAYNYFTAR